jgi:hypothetical protein
MLLSTIYSLNLQANVSLLLHFMSMTFALDLPPDFIGYLNQLPSHLISVVRLIFLEWLRFLIL